MVYVSYRRYGYARIPALEQSTLAVELVVNEWLTLPDTFSQIRILIAL